MTDERVIKMDKLVDRLKPYQEGDQKGKDICYYLVRSKADGARTLIAAGAAYMYSLDDYFCDGSLSCEGVIELGLYGSFYSVGA